MHTQTAFFYEKLLIKRVLGRIGQGLRLIITDVCYAEVLEDLKQRLAVVTERHCAVVFGQRARISTP